MNDTTISALIEATIGHLYLPELDEKTKALGISETAVMAATSVLHEAMRCTEPDPTYDDLDQMMTTCKRCEAVAVVVLKLGVMLSRPIGAGETGGK